MPRKKTVLTDEQRAKNLEEVGQQIETSDNPKDLEKALKKLVPQKSRGTPRKPN